MLEDVPDERNAENEHGNKTGQVYGRLKSLIVLQKLPPRSPLEMRNIAERFGVSITPVREALILLANEGIIAKDGSRSYLTRQLNAREMQNDYEAAFLMAKFCIEQGVDRFSATGLRLVDDKTLVKQTALDNVRATALTIEALYERVAGLTENERLVRLMIEFNDRTRFIRQLDFQNSRRLEISIAAMAEFLELLEARDVERAVKNLEQQYNQKRDIIPALVKEGNLIALDAVDIFNE